MILYSILHISDLHRSPADPISNAELLASLSADRDRYVLEEPSIRAPDAIVVSGDVIQGVPLGHPQPDVEIARQYDIAYDFLVSLTDEFLGGDRSRVVVVLGNHDVDWNAAKAAMDSLAPADIPPKIASELVNRESQYRWDWNTRAAYRIRDQSAYLLRFRHYQNFVRRFYDDTPVPKFDPEGPFNLHSLAGGTIGVAAFNSCTHNDCFRFDGHINLDAIAAAKREMVNRRYSFQLRMAVWHHNIEGPPLRSDYMDVEVVYSMIGMGFRLGLYGHQHKIQAEPRSIFLSEIETIATVSAGSLCAGDRELPRGVNRQYNVIEISDDLKRARVHVREMRIANIFGRAALANQVGRSYSELQWDTPKDVAGRPEIAGHELLVRTTARAEELLREGDSPAAIELLAPHAARLSQYGRQLLVEAAVAESNWRLVIEVTDPPLTVAELVFRVQAMLADQPPQHARDCLDRFARSLDMPQPQENELRERISITERMRT